MSEANHFVWSILVLYKQKKNFLGFLLDGSDRWSRGQWNNSQVFVFALLLFTCLLALGGRVSLCSSSQPQI